MRHARDVDVVRGEVEEERAPALRSMKRDGLRVSVSAMSSSVQSADFPPVMYPIRLTPFTIAWSWPWLGFIFSSSG